jgi:hypothetical protein
MDEESILDKFKQAIDSIIPNRDDIVYPKEAIPIGTMARSIPENRLGVVTDAYYGDVDISGKKIIVYTIMLFPDKSKTMYKAYPSDSILVVNEYEYDVIAYLMVPPLNLVKLSKFLKESSI